MNLRALLGLQLYCSVYSMTQAERVILRDFSKKLKRQQVLVKTRCPGEEEVLTFKMEKHIGKGGASFIFQARQIRHVNGQVAVGKSVALKMIPFDLHFADKLAKEEFKRMQIVDSIQLKTGVCYFDIGPMKLSVIVMHLMAGDFFSLLVDIERLRDRSKPDRSDVRERTENFIVSFIAVWWEMHEEVNAKLTKMYQSATLDTKPENVFLRRNAGVEFWLKLPPHRWNEELRSQIVVGDIGHGLFRHGGFIAVDELTYLYCPSRLFNPKAINAPKTLEDARIVFANAALHVLERFLPRPCMRQYEDLIDIKKSWFQHKATDFVAVVRKSEASVVKCYEKYFERTQTRSRLEEILQRVVDLRTNELEQRSLF